MSREHKRMSLACRLGMHDMSAATEQVQLRGVLKVTTRECTRCGVRRGWTDRVD